MNGDNVTYFDSFVVQHIPKEIKKFIKKIFYRMQAMDSDMHGYYYIFFTDFMLKIKFC